MKNILTLILWAGFVLTCSAQKKPYKVVAESGDGIYSILRKQGLDPVKHYQEFVELNQENIKDGSFLHVGREYIIPFASESFKNTGVRVFLASDAETPIFENGLQNLSKESNALKNVVYYLITENEENVPNAFARDLEQNLAKTLIENGAHVFVLEQKGLTYTNPNNKDLELMGVYVEAINKRYLKHSGKYQRLLILRANGQIKRKMDVSIYHHEKSEDGQRLAQNLRQVFQKHSIKNRSYENIDAIFEDEKMLYLAKNVLPAVSLLDIDGTSDESKTQGIELISNKKSMAEWLANGILKDYADLKIEE